MRGTSGYSVVMPSLAPGAVVSPVVVGVKARNSSSFVVTVVTTTRVSTCGGTCHVE